MEGMELEIRQFELGPLANYVYLIADPASREALAIDPAWDVPALIRTLEEEAWDLRGVFLTHNHFDHVNGVGDLLRSKDVPVYIHRNDAEPLLKEIGAGLKPVDGGERISLGALDLSFLHTPGHTEGSTCLRVTDRLITGDTLFIRGCGRVDLPNSDPEKMFRSLQKIAGLEDKILVLPGHNYGPSPMGSLEDEKKENPYLNLAMTAPLREFLRLTGA